MIKTNKLTESPQLRKFNRHLLLMGNDIKSVLSVENVVYLLLIMYRYGMKNA